VTHATGKEFVECAVVFDCLLVLLFNARRSELVPTFADYVLKLAGGEVSADDVSVKACGKTISQLCQEWRHLVK
jgi:hypothetical protein